MHHHSRKRLLVLSVGYGQGHHSAAAALAEHYTECGWDAQVADVCQMAHPWVFRITQLFYQLCVRRAPWLWGITYSLTDTADWCCMVRRRTFRGTIRCLRTLLRELQPDLIICTYPLFAYMLDKLKADGEQVPPYAVVVTDALEISRPWLLTQAELLLLPDEYSRLRVMERYALPAEKVAATGFPVRRVFSPSVKRTPPDDATLHVLYGAYRQTGGVVNDIAALLETFPQIKLSVIAGGRAAYLQTQFAPYCADGRLMIIDSTDDMAALLAESHLYIGKAGAATVFECYATVVPILINFTLPGQERGNLELLEKENAGIHVESTAHMVATVKRLLSNGALGWLECCQAMRRVNRSDAARRAACEIRSKLGV